jgi:hypothetical protein
MAVYRVLRDLACGNKTGAIGGVLYTGSLTRLEWLDGDGVSRLLDCGAVARAATPPLSVVPGWSVRAGKLQQIGIVTVEEFLEADTAEVMEHMEVKRASTIKKWREDATKEILVSVKPRRRR